jgi:hypothetical protein
LSFATQSALSVVSRQCSISVAFGAKRTFGAQRAALTEPDL